MPNIADLEEQVVPLYDPAPDAARHVRSPGGYEWLHFDAAGTGEAARLRLIARISHGWPLNPEYLARYQAYLRRPTRNAPPTPAQFAACQLDILDGPELALTHNAALTAKLESGGWRLRLPGAIDLLFRPSFAFEPQLKMLCPREWTNADHFWMIVAPLCEIEGEVTLPSRTIRFTGIGYHDRHFGSAPLLQLRQWSGGRVLEPDRAVMFQTALSKTGQAQTQQWIADSSGLHPGDGVIPIQIPPRPDDHRRTGGWRLDIDGSLICQTIYGKD